MVDPITCHILDTTLGKPASNVIVQLYHVSDTSETAKIQQFAISRTDNDGRIKNWTFDQNNADNEKYGIQGNQWVKLVPGVYKIKFLTGKYFINQNNNRTFFPYVEIIFQVDDPDEHYHIPLLLSNHSYTTYRGS
ncbi:unnamed protein product [Candida verbasci]|uniref:5-hydroxyisourate hydrolase n=1 Tax=Candida verbasci TaxID=1227364 RepID=A0A9W4XA64_9ASCO|nr:unnamed protein product [Candida verbasci]